MPSKQIQKQTQQQKAKQRLTPQQVLVGQMIEKAPTKELFSHTWHPYTKALLSAIPIPSLKNRKQREPDLKNLNARNRKWRTP